MKKIILLVLLFSQIALAQESVTSEDPDSARYLPLSRFSGGLSTSAWDTAGGGVVSSDSYSYGGFLGFEVSPHLQLRFRGEYRSYRGPTSGGGDLSAWQFYQEATTESITALAVDALYFWRASFERPNHGLYTSFGLGNDSVTYSYSHNRYKPNNGLFKTTDKVLEQADGGGSTLNSQFAEVGIGYLWLFKTSGHPFFTAFVAANYDYDLSQPTNLVVGDSNYSTTISANPNGNLQANGGFGLAF